MAFLMVFPVFTTVKAEETSTEDSGFVEDMDLSSEEIEGSFDVLIPTEASTPKLNVTKLNIAPETGYQLVATLPEGEEGTITWTSSKEEVATVSESGYVYAVGVGTTTIKAYNGSRSASCSVSTVPTSIKLSATKTEIQPGETTKITAEIEPAGNWSNYGEATISNEDVLRVVEADDNTAILIGGDLNGRSSATSTVKLKIGSKTASITIKVKEITYTGLTLSDTKLSMAPGNTHKLYVKADSASSISDVIWTSTKEDVATVSDDGLVTALDVGTTTIKAKVGSKTLSCSVSVQPTKITLKATKDTLKIDETAKVTAVIEPAGDWEIEWTSSNSNIVDVDDDRTITAIGTNNKSSATANIKAKVGSKSAQLKITVNAPQPGNVVLNEKNKKIQGGEKFTLVATTDTDNGYLGDLKWTSSNDNVAKVKVSSDKQSATIEGIAKGKSVITVTNGKMKAICKVTVNASKPTFTFPATKSAKKGEIVKLKAVMKDCSPNAKIAFSIISGNGTLMTSDTQLYNGNEACCTLKSGKKGQVKVKIVVESYGLSANKTCTVTFK